MFPLWAKEKGKVITCVFNYTWRRKWQPTPGLLPGKSCGQRSLAGYRPRGHKRVRRDLATKQTTINYTIKWILTSVFSNRIFIPFAMSISQWSLGTRVTFLFSIPNVPSGSSSQISQSSISPRKHVFFIRFLIFLPLHFRVLPFRVALNFPSLAHYSIQGLTNSGHCLGHERM